jgi:hypothetical protein
VSSSCTGNMPLAGCTAEPSGLLDVYKHRCAVSSGLYGPERDCATLLVRSDKAERHQSAVYVTARVAKARRAP